MLKLMSITNDPQAAQLFSCEIQKLRACETSMRPKSPQFFEENRAAVQKIVQQIAESIE